MAVAELPVRIPAGRTVLDGILHVPQGDKGMVVFAHGSGSSRLSPRNRYVARFLHDAGFGTLLFDLLDPREEQADALTGNIRFDVRLLAERLVVGTAWVAALPEARDLTLGYFGAS